MATKFSTIGKNTYADDMLPMLKREKFHLKQNYWQRLGGKKFYTEKTFGDGMLLPILIKYYIKEQLFGRHNFIW